MGRLILGQDLISSKLCSYGCRVQGPAYHVRKAHNVGGFLFIVGTFLGSFLISSFFNSSSFFISGIHSSFDSSKW